MKNWIWPKNLKKIFLKQLLYIFSELNSNSYMKLFFMPKELVIILLFSSMTLKSALAGTFNVNIEEKGFEPTVFEVKVGEKVTINFIRKIEKTCGNKVTIPAEGIIKDLPLNKKVTVEFTPKERGSMVFGCHPDLMQEGMIIVN